MGDGYLPVPAERVEVQGAGVAVSQPLDDAAFRRLVEGAAADPIVLLDPDGAVAAWNEGARRLLGYRADEIVGAPFAALFRPEDQRAGQPARQLAQARRDGHRQDETWLVRRNGGRFWGSLAVTAIRDARGQLRGFATLARDITAPQRAEARQRFLADAGRALVESLDYPTTLARVARLAVPDLADWCTVSLVEDNGSIVRLAVVHRDPAKEARLREVLDRYPPPTLPPSPAWPGSCARGRRRSPPSSLTSSSSPPPAPPRTWRTCARLASARL
jgi:PAS domain S-box-containing protein